MSVLEKETVGATEVPERLSRATTAGLCALLLAPVAGTVASLAEIGVIGDIDPNTDPAGFLVRVAERGGLWDLMSVALLVMAILTIAWVPAVWRATVRRTPRWAWVAAVVGTLFAGGQVVHLVTWNVLSGALAAQGDPAAAQGLTEAMDASWFFMLIFAPYLIGAVFALVFAAVALRRAGLVPTWSVVAVAAASVGIGVLGTANPVMLVAYPVLVIVAFGPAVVRRVRG